MAAVKREEVSSDDNSDEIVCIKSVPPPQLTDDDLLVLCKVCLDSKVSQILFPCRHACICENCFDKLECPKECPVCRTLVFRNIPFILEC